jgi:hypothetical protein
MQLIIITTLHHHGLPRTVAPKFLNIFVLQLVQYRTQACHTITAHEKRKFSSFKLQANYIHRACAGRGNLYII